MEKIRISSDTDTSVSETLIDCKNHKHAMKLLHKYQQQMARKFKYSHPSPDNSWGEHDIMVYSNDFNSSEADYTVVSRVVCSQKHYDKIMQYLGVLIPF